jgi:hypothetical protein
VKNNPTMKDKFDSLDKKWYLKHILPSNRLII